MSTHKIAKEDLELVLSALEDAFYRAEGMTQAGEETAVQALEFLRSELENGGEDDSEDGDGDSDVSGESAGVPETEAAESEVSTKSKTFP